MKRKLRCFVSAPPGKWVGVIRSILGRLQVEAFDAYQIEEGGTIYRRLKSEVRSSDFAIVVVTDNNKSSLYELGICEGLGKVILVIVEDQTRVPLFVHQYVYFAATPDNYEVLRLSITNYVDQVRNDKAALRARRKPVRTAVKAGDIHDYLSIVKKARLEGSALELEELVRNVFETLNVSLEVLTHKTRDAGVDFGIWHDNLNDAIGNPIFVELETGNLTESRIASAEEQLGHCLEKSDAKAGLLLYLDQSGQRFNENYALSPLIVRYDLEDFLQTISKQPFDRAILARRSAMAHGKS